MCVTVYCMSVRRKQAGVGELRDTYRATHRREDTQQLASGMAMMIKPHGQGLQCIQNLPGIIYQLGSKALNMPRTYMRLSVWDTFQGLTNQPSFLLHFSFASFLSSSLGRSLLRTCDIALCGFIFSISLCK